MPTPGAAVTVPSLAGFLFSLSRALACLLLFSPPLPQLASDEITGLSLLLLPCPLPTILLLQQLDQRGVWDFDAFCLPPYKQPTRI